MRIGVSGSGTPDRVVEQAIEAEAAGFSSLWCPGAVGGDPLIALAMAAWATTSIELGTSVLQTYPTHPVVLANRALATVAGMGRPGLALGIGPSHQFVIERTYGMSFDHPGRHTEEYVTILTDLLAGEAVDFHGEDLAAKAGPLAAASADAPLPVLLAALGPRLLRVAGERTSGTILWMANARAIETHVVPRITKAAAAAGRPSPRIVAGLPVAVHDDVDEAREVAARQFAVYGTLPNYQRILAAGGIAAPAEAAALGSEDAVAETIAGLFRAGATDVWTAPFPVGDDRRASRSRTRALLEDLAAQAL